MLHEIYPWIKALHIMAVISWMAGLFYLPRLFVYHSERARSGDTLDETFQIMEDKLMRIIMQPAMMVSWTAGLILLMTPGIADWSSAWLWLKLGSVVAMTVLHIWLKRHVSALANGQAPLSGRHYRIINEVPTLLMAVIVIMVVVRPF